MRTQSETWFSICVATCASGSLQQSVEKRISGFRDREFAARGDITPAELAKRLETAVEDDVRIIGQSRKHTSPSA